MHRGNNRQHKHCNKIAYIDVHACKQTYMFTSCLPILTSTKQQTTMTSASMYVHACVLVCMCMCLCMCLFLLQGASKLQSGKCEITCNYKKHGMSNINRLHTDSTCIEHHRRQQPLQLPLQLLLLLLLLLPLEPSQQRSSNAKRLL